MKFLTKALFAAGAALGGGAAALNACVVARTAPAVRRLSDLDGRSADAILVLGAGVEPDGRMSDMLADRVEVAIALYRRGAGRKLLLSGDGRPGYDEPAAMRRAVLRAGVPEEALLLDRRGVSTAASVRRARTVFGTGTLVIVTQEDHLYRALYLAENAGIDAVGVSASLRPYRSRKKQAVREFLARSKDAGRIVLQGRLCLGGKQGKQSSVQRF